MEKIIGRKKEIDILDQAFYSDDPEFIAVYGRRRVGKTYLVRNLFKDRKNTTFFYVSGIKDGSLEEQIQTFLSELFYTFDYRGPRAGLETSWNNVFRLLTELIRKAPTQKIVLFFDEFPWMVTPAQNFFKCSIIIGIGTGLWKGGSNSYYAVRLLAGS
jgi:AAA+ ATPase superfamily predicted ATPase